MDIAKSAFQEYGVYQGYQIYIPKTEGGFVTYLGDRKVKRFSLKDLKKLIEGQGHKVKAMILSLGHNSFNVRQVSVVKVEADGRCRLDNRQLINEWGSATYFYDQPLVEAAALIVQAYQTLQKRWQALHQKVTKITKDNFKPRQSVEVEKQAY